MEEMVIKKCLFIDSLLTNVLKTELHSDNLIEWLMKALSTESVEECNKIVDLMVEDEYLTKSQVNGVEVYSWKIDKKKV